MKSKNILIITIFVIVAVAVISFYVKSQNKKPFPKKPASTRNQPQQITKKPNYQFPPAIEKIDTTKDGPWNEDLYYAKSKDGTSFGKSSIFVQAAGVPSITRDSKTRLITAFQWFPKKDKIHFDQVAVSISKDNGKTWTKPQPIKIANLPDGYQRPYDPTVVTLPNGKIRMYFTSATTFNDNSSIFSAISSDGVNYIFEPGKRFGVTGKMVIDSTAGRLDGGWHMTGSFDDLGMQGTGYHATSTDGLSFVRAPNLSFDKDHIWIGNILASENELRFYGSGPNIWWTSTKNGESWLPPVETNLMGGDPAILKLTDSQYLIIYVGQAKDELSQKPEN